jgi:hypothetical protein
MRKLFFSTALLLCTALAIVSCRREEEATLRATDRATAEDLLAHNDLSEQVDFDADEALDGLVGTEITDRNDCPTVTLAQPRGTWPNTITLDYSDAGCTKGGRTFKGKVVIEQTNPMNVDGAVRTIGFVNFFVEDVLIEGSKTVSNAGNNTAGLPKFNVSVDEKLTYPDGTVATHTATRERTMTEGSSTTTRNDDVWTVTGGGQGVNRSGDTYASTITTALVKRNPCAWIGEGVIEFSLNGLTRTLDFGDGTCDREATITRADGTVRNIKIRHFWWR